MAISVADGPTTPILLQVRLIEDLLKSFFNSGRKERTYGKAASVKNR
jgi:hypothetical protein